MKYIPNFYNTTEPKSIKVAFKIKNKIFKFHDIILTF